MFYSYWTSASFAVLSVQRASYVISVRQTRVLSTASFRFHLAMDTLAFNYTLTTAGRIRDLHPLEFAHAGQTSSRTLAINWLEDLSNHRTYRSVYGGAILYNMSLL